MRTMKTRILTIILISIVLISCTPQSNNPSTKLSPSPTVAKLEQGLGGITGKVALPSEWIEENVYAYAAPYVGDPEAEGIFILDKNSTTNSIISPGGHFQISNLNPGLYILLLGTSPNSARPHAKDGSAIKIEVLPNEYVDLGVIDPASN
jgi:hypothetical protein